MILIKVRTAEPCMTSKFPFVSMCNKRYISKPENKEADQFLGRLSPPCRFFLFSVYLAEFPSGAWVLTKPANFALAFKFHARGSPRWGTLRYSNRCWWPNVDGVNSLSWSFIGIPHKPSYSASFSPLIFPTTLSVSNLSLSL